MNATESKCLECGQPAYRLDAENVYHDDRQIDENSHTAVLADSVPIQSDNRFCPQCGADVIGNDPHAPWCSVGLGNPNVMGDSVPIQSTPGPVASERGREILTTYAERYEYTEPQELDPNDVGSFLGDVVADLLHYAASLDLSDSFIDMARIHFEEEANA